MYKCGTSEACEGCPVSANIPQGEYGVFNYAFGEAETLGTAAVNLHIEGYNELSDEAALAVVRSHGISHLDDAPKRLQMALGRIGTEECNDNNQ